MTVTEGKATIIDVLEQLQKQGVWVRGIEVTWFTDVEAKDVPKPGSKTRCEIKLVADL